MLFNLIPSLCNSARTHLIHLRQFCHLLLNIFIGFWTLESNILFPAPLPRIYASQLQGRTLLKEIKMIEVSLEEFPNCTYVANILEILDLSKNLLTTVPPDLLNMLINLQELKLAYNKLSTLPDVAGPGNTLKLIRINNNYFEEFPSLKKLGRSVETVIAGYMEEPKIKVIDPNNIGIGHQTAISVGLAGNAITRIVPMITTTGNMPVIKFYMMGNPLVLDYRLSWLAGSKLQLYMSPTPVGLEDLGITPGKK